jgi:hypothetical protein
LHVQLLQVLMVLQELFLLVELTTLRLAEHMEFFSFLGLLPALNKAGIFI